jgi:hypothetical protein
MDTSIEFVFQGIIYKVSPEALDLKKSALPDMRVLNVQGWFESDDQPPQIYLLSAILTLIMEDSSPEGLANQVKGALAHRN